MRMTKHITAIALKYGGYTQAAFVTAGLCASAVMGTGTAHAADGRGDVFATTGTAKSAAAATQAQADGLEKNSEKKADEKKAAKKADEKKAAKKAAAKKAAKKAAAKKAAERKAAAKEKAADKKAAKKKAVQKRAAAKKAAAKKAAERKAAAKRAAAKKAKAARAWVAPVAKPYTLTATFGNAGDRWTNKHSGQDFAVPTGTSVKAAHKGVVVTAGWGGAYGNNIVIKHANGQYTQYAHLSKFSVNVGERVSTNEQIALSGNTGNSSGPHLHFEVRTTPYYGSAVDPMAALRSYGAKA